MFGEQEVLIPSMLLCSCSLCDSPNSSTCVAAACAFVGEEQAKLTGQEGQLRKRS